MKVNSCVSLPDQNNQLITVRLNKIKTIEMPKKKCWWGSKIWVKSLRKMIILTFFIEIFFRSHVSLYKFQFRQFIPFLNLFQGQIEYFVTCKSWKKIELCAKKYIHTIMFLVYVQRYS